MIPFTSVSTAKNTLLLLENANVATSAVPLGAVAGVQFAAEFQFPEFGLVFQVALPAKAAAAWKTTSMTTPWSALPLDSLATAGRGEARTRAMVFITRFVRHFRFMAGECNEISFGRDLWQRLRLAINKIIHHHDIMVGCF
jgi:hypothetical protein